jgi:hypothetical protein
MKLSSFVVLSAAFAVGMPAGSLADVGFTPPSGWAPITQTSAPGATRTTQMWKDKPDAADAQVLTVVSDSTVPYADVVSTIQKNAAAGGLTIKKDMDSACMGKTGHLIAIEYGTPDLMVVSERLIVPSDTGTIQLTYTRRDSQRFVDDVQKSISAFCGNPIQLK